MLQRGLEIQAYWKGFGYGVAEAIYSVYVCSGLFKFYSKLAVASFAVLDHHTHGCYDPSCHTIHIPDLLSVFDADHPSAFARPASDPEKLCTLEQQIVHPPQCL